MLSSQFATADDLALVSRTTVKTLGVVFDQDIQFTSYIKDMSRMSLFHFRNRKIKLETSCIKVMLRN